MLFVLLPEMVKIGIILMCTQYFMDWKYFSDCTRIPLILSLLYNYTYIAYLWKKLWNMGRQVLKISNYTSEEIKSMFRDDERYTIGIRLYAVYQVSLGQSSRSLEELYNTSFKQITNWVHRFEKEGIEGLRDKKGRGRTSRLSETQRNRIRRLLSESPEDYGYNNATWTGPMLIEWIKKEMGVTYQKAQIYNILKRLGYSYQRGKGVFPEADKQQQEVFKEALKKTDRKS